MKKFSISILSVLLASTIFLTSCAADVKEKKADNTKVEQQAQKNEALINFIDDLNHKRAIPENLTKIAPSGSLAQVFLASFDADKISGLAKKLPKKSLQYLPERLKTLPEFGQFYGKNTNFNLEAVIKEKVELILDIGEEKKTHAQDMDQIMEQTGIPTVFIKAGIDNLDHTFSKMGELLNNKKRGDELSSYVKNLYQYVAEHKEKMQDKKIRVYMALGDDGLSTNAKTSFHSELLNFIGVENVVDLPASTKGEGTKVSMEQLINYKPQFILCQSKEILESIQNNPAWKSLNAKFILIPSEPFNYIMNPPSANRLLGIYWLGNALAPDIYDFDIKDKMKEFYKLFWHYELSNEEITHILSGK